MNRVFVTGGSGFVGSAVIDELVARGSAVTALVNRKPVDPRGDRVRSVPGGIFDAKAMVDAMYGCAAVIHLVGIIMEKPPKGITFERVHYEGARNVIDAAGRAGVRRFVHMSALGVRPTAVSAYHRTKFKAEEHLRASGLDWTILRPSLIHGPRGEFMRMEAAWARGKAPPFLFMPYFGAGALGRGGAGKLQPVFVGDVARAFVECLTNPRTVREVYPLGGPDEFTWPALHRAVAQAVVGKRRPVAAIPAWYARLLTRVVPRALLPFNRDQVTMSQEDNTADLAKFREHFGWTPRAFVTALGEYAKEVGVT